jgi:hypothetical protein
MGKLHLLLYGNNNMIGLNSKSVWYILKLISYIFHAIQLGKGQWMGDQMFENL